MAEIGAAAAIKTPISYRRGNYAARRPILFGGAVAEIPIEISSQLAEEGLSRVCGSIFDRVVPRSAPGIETRTRICELLILRADLSSRPEDSHLRALPDPYVNLSIHTAPDVRPFP